MEGFIFFIGASRTCIASSPSTRLSVNKSKYVTSGALEVEVALRVQLNPAVKRRTLQGDEFFEQAIHGTSFVLSGHRAGHTSAPSAPGERSRRRAACTQDFIATE